MERNIEQQLERLAAEIRREKASRSPRRITFTTITETVATVTPTTRQASTGQGGKVSEGKT